MSTVKRILGDYTIQSIGVNDNVNINTNVFTINGNLVVNGNTTAIESTNTNIWDNIIVLNAGTTGSPALNAGITVDRGTSSNVQLRWNEGVTNWQVTTDGSTYSNIATASGSIANVYADSAPTLGANLKINGHTIYNTAYNVTAYAGTPSRWNTGLFIDNINGTTQEIASKRATIAYSIIFG